MFTISNTAKLELRKNLQKIYGDDFEASLSEEEVNEIGDLLLNILAESLKIKSNSQH